MEFVLARLWPGDTVLDIGAGTGRWSIPMAKVRKKVTALDASPGMLEVLREKAAAEKVTNINVHCTAPITNANSRAARVAVASDNPQLIGMRSKDHNTECNARS